MENLYERLLPKVKNKLLDNKEKYKVSVGQVTRELKAVDTYVNLKMNTIHLLMIFSETDPKDQWQLKWGDCFFSEKVIKYELCAEELINKLENSIDKGIEELINQ